MVKLLSDRRLEKQLSEQRRAWGADHHDEVWDGIYFFAPLPDDDHQHVLLSLAGILRRAIAAPGLGKVRPGVNLADFDGKWEHDYRVPDVAVFLETGSAENCGSHWRGAADFVVEITTPGDRTDEKIPFYSRLGVRELLIVDQQPWAIRLYRRWRNELRVVGQSSRSGGELLTSAVVPLEFRLVRGRPRPKIEVVSFDDGRRWVV
jgi:hypothetical protein